MTHELSRQSSPDVAYQVARVAGVERLPRRSIVVGERAVILTGAGDLVVGYHLGPTTSAQRITLDSEQLVALSTIVDRLVGLSDE